MNDKSQWKQKFFTIITGQTISLVGSSAVQFALIWWLASQTASPLVMSMAGLVSMLPQAILGPFAGVWIDRIKKKSIVIGADMFMGFAALVIAAVFYVGQPPYWSVFVVLLVRGIGNVFQGPAMQSVVPMLVPADELVRVNGWSQFMQSGAFMLGPVLGAIMYAGLPMWLILLTDFFGALIASGALAPVKLHETLDGHRENPHFWREFKEGMAVYKRDKQLGVLLVLSTFSMIFFMPLSSYYPLMTSDYFAGTAFQASLVEFLYAAGMMGSALVVGMFGKVQHKLRMAYLGLAGVGITSLLCGVLPSQMWAFGIFALLCCLMGASGNFYNIPCVAYMQENIPPEAQGRAFSLMGSVMSLAMPVGLVISGPVAEHYGIVVWFLISGICTVASAAAGLLYQRSDENK